MEQGFGIYLRHLREARGLSVRRLALLAGIRHATLSDWETEKRQPRIPELEAALAALGATPTEGREALALLRAPRAAARLRAETMRLPLAADLGPMPSGGDLLRAMRHRRGFYLAQVAERLGVSSATLSRWEQGKIVPPSEGLDRLLTLLKATPRERFALSNNTLFLLPPLSELAGSPASLEAISSPFLWPNIYESGARILRARIEAAGGQPLRHLHWHIAALTQDDLTYLSLAAQSWRLAREPKARRLLAEIYANYATHLATARRFSEAYDCAHQALDLLADKSTPERFYVRAAIIAARSSVYRGAQPAPQRGLEMLRLWFPLAAGVEYKAWTLAEMAEYSALAGTLEKAIALSEQACEVVRDAASGQELSLRRRDLAKWLLQAGRPAEALALAQMTDWDEPHHRVSVELLRAESLLKLGEAREAADWLQRAYENINAYHLEPQRAQADTLAQQL